MDVCEHMNGVLEQYLRCYINYQNNWIDLLPFAKVPYNNAIQGLPLLKWQQDRTLYLFLNSPKPPHKLQPRMNFTIAKHLASFESTQESMGVIQKTNR